MPRGAECHDVATIMTTKPSTVGVRELKAEAPRLVKRAAGGERIVITRYGRPAAVLGPADDGAGVGPAERPRFVAWEAERRAFEGMQPAELTRYQGKWVAVHRGRIVAADADHERLFRRTWRKLKGAQFFIARVGAPAPVVDMPGFEIS